MFRPPFFPRLSTLVAAAPLLIVPLLAGCSGVVKNLNSAQVKAPTVTVDNALGIAGQVVANVPASGGTPAAQAYPFPNQPPINAADVQSATLAVSLAPTVSVTAPQGQALPATFTLSSLSVTPEADKLDAAGNVTSRLTLSPLATSAPVTFTQTSPGVYAASAPVTLGQATPVSAADAQALAALITGGADANRAVLTITAASAGLPTGTTLSFTVGSSQLLVRTGS